MKQTQMSPRLIIACAKEGHFSFSEVSKVSHPKGPTVWQSLTGPVGEYNEVTPPSGCDLESPLTNANDAWQTQHLCKQYLLMNIIINPLCHLILKL